MSTEKADYGSMTLKEKRWLFSQLICEHGLWITSQGWHWAFAEGMDRITTKDPTSDHKVGSLHNIGLAQDIDLYDAEGRYVTDTKTHMFSGIAWEKLHPLCRWGGWFGDGNHYSLEYEGRK